MTSDEGVPAEFLAEAERAGLAHCVRTIDHGETYAFDLDAIRGEAAARVAMPQPAPHAELR